MRVGFEIPYYSPGMRGASQYAFNMVRALGRIFPNDDFLAFTYFFRNYQNHYGRLSHLASKNIKIIVPRWSQKLVQFCERKFSYPWIEKKFVIPNQCDVFHDAQFHPINSRTIPRIYTIHGFPMNLSGVSPFFEKIAAPALQQPDQIIAISNCIRDLLLKRYSIPKERMRVIPYGVDHQTFRPIKDQEILRTIAQKYNLPEKFILCVGPFQFRDNIEQVLYSMHQVRCSTTLKDIKLVLAGGLEEHGSQLVSQINRLDLTQSVQLLGYVPHSDLAVIYNLAIVLAHPSFYEEFGLQLLEACACGTPIIASDSGGIRESAGNAPEYFNPFHSAEFETVLFNVLGNESLRREMSARGNEQAKKFSWESVAAETMDIYRTIGNGYSDHEKRKSFYKLNPPYNDKF